VEEPAAGWKLHVSATVLNAVRVLKKVAPVLAAYGIQFKAPASLVEVMRLNAGSYYGYTQIGKIITVYPRTAEEGLLVAEQLHNLTRRMAAPSVPFDLRYALKGNIYYRFGAFQPLAIKHEDGKSTPAVRDPAGELVPDLRQRPKPDWTSDPFRGRSPNCSRKSQNPLSTSYQVLRALAQRGKGGVYQAIDLSQNPPRLCLIKEGRKHGEVTWDGRDGRWRIRNEERVLQALLADGVEVPRVYSSFEVDGNAYLAIEFIDGETLQSLLSRLRKRMPISRVLKYGIQLATLFSQMHAVGWVWRDCKPSNLIVTRKCGLKPLDFEGACPVDRPDFLFWGTPGFTPPEWRSANRQTGLPDDLYALGSIIYLLATGRVPDATNPATPEKLRPTIPPELSSLIISLLASDPKRRPNAQAALAQLKCAERKRSPRDRVRGTSRTRVATENRGGGKADRLSAVAARAG
jgi:class IV lanthipeptide synthase